MKKKLLAILLVTAMSVGVLAGCGTTEEKSTEETPVEGTDSSGKKTKITFLSGKPEIIPQIELALKEFTVANPDIEVELVQGESGTSPYQAMTVMYNSGNAASVFMMEMADVPKLKDKLVDLSGEQFNNDALPAALQPVTVDGAVYGAPFACESVGFIYNKSVIKEAIGEDFDPSTIKSLDDLKALYEAVDGKGIAPTAISSEDWSLGAHFMGYMYSNQFPNDIEKNNQFTEDLKAGNVDLMTNEVFNGWLDTFDLMKANNVGKADPMANNSDASAAKITQNEAATWFQGVFMWPVLQGLNTDPENLGIMHIPVTKDSSDSRNTTMLNIYSMYLCIDKEQNSPEQQEAAKKLIDWLLYSEEGQKQVVNEMQILPPYTHITLEPNNPLNKSLMEYINAGKTVDLNITYPSDHWQELGGAMQEYLVDRISREELATKIQDYWKNVQ